MCAASEAVAWLKENLKLNNNKEAVALGNNLLRVCTHAHTRAHNSYIIDHLHTCALSFANGQITTMM